MSTVSTCSTAEAQTLAQKFQMGDANYGRVAMAFRFTGTAAFHSRDGRFTAGEWQLVLKRDTEVAVLAAVGSDIRATVDVFRTGDSHCISTGGRHSRIWRWDGQRFVAAPWKQVTPPDKKQVRSDGAFKTPSASIFCNYYGIDVGRSVPFLYCGIKSGIKPPAPRKGQRCTRALWPLLQPTGRAVWVGSTCRGNDEPQGPILELAHTVLSAGSHHKCSRSTQSRRQLEQALDADEPDDHDRPLTRLRMPIRGRVVRCGDVSGAAVPR